MNRKAFLPGILLIVGASVLLAGTSIAQNIARNVPFATSYYTYTLQSDIVYGEGEVGGGGSFTDLELDLYVPDIPPPANATNKLPLMLMIHGGGFQDGSKTSPNILNMAPRYAERGWLVASINYRLIGDSPIPSSRVQALYDAIGGASAPAQAVAAIAAVDDTLTALDFLHARGDVDDSWTTLWGSSAGAVTSLMAAYCLDDFGIASPPMAAVIDLAGGLYNCAVGNPFDDPAGTDPVLMVIHGTDDAEVPFAQATALQGWATAVGLPLDFQAVIDGGHVPNLFANNATTGVTLYQRTVDYHHETVFAGLEQGPQPLQPSGC